ncbi:MAG TPA: hypothetical protein VGM85_12895 [Paraburkholderia sp.]
MADELDQISKGLGSAAGSELLGNLTANVVAGLGGALVGGTGCEATASNVELLQPVSCESTGSTETNSRERPGLSFVVIPSRGEMVRQRSR